MISIRFEIPGLSSRRTISRPESATARRNLRRIVSGSSSTYTVPCSDAPVVDILRSGLLEVAHARADLGDAGLGHHEQLAEALLKRSAMSRISSRCSRWSSPTGTSWAR